MQKPHDSILRAVNSNKKYNILTFPTHEASQHAWGALPHTFYLMQGKDIKPWNNKFASLPNNHILLPNSENAIPPDVQFDIVLSQNKFGQFQMARQIALMMNLPLISFEHTLPFIGWNKKQTDQISSMKGDLNVFITNYSMEKWGYSLENKTVRVLKHGINTDKFKPNANSIKDGRILSVVNDWLNRDWCCNFSLYKQVCLDNNLPVNPVGDTPNISLPAKSTEDLIDKYQNASVFINTSIISPVPHALLEAMACGCPVVTAATCEIPKIIKDGENGFCSNDKEYLKERLIWCLENQEKAQEMGLRARETILKDFSLEQHLLGLDNIFNEVIGKGFNFNG